MTLAFAESGTQHRPAPVLLVLGDSLSAAYGIDPRKGWVALLTEKLAAQNAGITVVNASVSGATTAAGHAALPALLAKHRPSWVFLELGANDGLQGLPLPYIENSLESLIKQIQAAQAEVILFGMQLPPNLGERYTKPFTQLFADLANKHKLQYVPFLLDRVAGQEALMLDDGLHPNEKGQPLILENVWSVVGTGVLSEIKQINQTGH